MHNPLLVSMSSDNNSQHFADLGAAFAAADPPINISNVGGAEFDGTGVFTFLIDDDTEERIEAARVIAEDELHFRFQRIASRTIELSNRPGELGRAAAQLAAAGINILSILVVGVRAGRTLVSIGVEPGQMEGVTQNLTGFNFLPDELGSEGAES
jgi:hypothetical protein